MQAALYPSPSSSTATAAAATTPTRARIFASFVCRRPKGGSQSKLYGRGAWLDSGTRAFLLHSSPQSFPGCRTLPAVECKVPIVTQDTFPDEVLKSEEPVLVGFCADWCGPCKLIAPVIDTVAKEFNGSLKAVKVDVDKNPDLVKEYEVYGLPTVIVFKDGKEVPNSRKEGAINAKKLKALLDGVLPTIAST